MVLNCFFHSPAVVFCKMACIALSFSCSIRILVARRNVSFRDVTLPFFLCTHVHDCFLMFPLPWPNFLPCLHLHIFYLLNIMELAMLATTLDHFLCDHPEPWRSPRAPGRIGLGQKRDFADRFFQYRFYYKNVTFIDPDGLPWISADSGRRPPMSTLWPSTFWAAGRRTFSAR